MRPGKSRRLYEDVKAGVPGHRFRRFYERHRWGPYWRMGALVGGTTLVLTGALLGPVPIAPGFVFVILGLALLGTASRTVAGWLDRLEAALRRRLR